MGLLAFINAAFGAASEGAPTRPFDLPADSAEQSLKRFSAQSGLQVLFATELTDGVRANAVKGDFTPMDAADRLLAGTPLRIVRDETTGVISVARIMNFERAPPKKKEQRVARLTEGDRPIIPNPLE